MIEILKSREHLSDIFFFKVLIHFVDNPFGFLEIPEGKQTY